MDKLTINKAMLTGIFNKSYELGDADDSYFIKIIRAGIEKAEEVDPGIFSELFEHAIEEYIKVWMREAEDDEDEQEEREEAREEARETFLEYYHEDEDDF
jgi:hypothetical protein